MNTDEEGTQEGKLSEEEIQQVVGYRKLMKKRAVKNAEAGCKISLGYLSLINSCDMARQIDNDLDYSDDSDDIEMHY